MSIVHGKPTAVLTFAQSICTRKKRTRVPTFLSRVLENAIEKKSTRFVFYPIYDFPSISPFSKLGVPRFWNQPGTSFELEKERREREWKCPCEKSLALPAHTCKQAHVSRMSEGENQSLAAKTREDGAKTLRRFFYGNAYASSAFMKGRKKMRTGFL